MCRSLRNHELEVAIALTEGLISDLITSGPSFKLCSEYIHSPLEWAIVTSEQSDNPIHSIKDLEGKTIGISRVGSGSYHMSYLLADREKWDAKNLKFETIGGLSDLRQAVQSRTIDTFLWETFML